MIFFIFDNEAMIGISDKAIETIDNKYPFLESLKENFVVNKAAILMDRLKFEEASKILIEAVALTQRNFRYDKLLLVKGRLAICQKIKKRLNIACWSCKKWEQMTYTEVCKPS